MLMELDQLILRLWEGKFTVDEVVVQHKNMLCKEFFFRLAELANAANGVERDR